MISTLTDILSEGNAEDTAILDTSGQGLTYSLLADEVERLAGIISTEKLGLKRGDAVSITLSNGIEFMTVFLAVARAGFAAAPLNPKYTEDEFRFFLNDSESKVVIAPIGAHPSKDTAKKMSIKVVEAAPFMNGKTALSFRGSELVNHSDPTPPNPADVALLLHTSGTTSRPKGVPLRHVNIVASLKNHIRILWFEQCRYCFDGYAAFPCARTDRRCAFHPVFQEVRRVIPSQFSAGKFWDAQRRTNATWYSAVPTIHQILLARADTDGAPSEVFRFIRSCSAALAPANLKGLETRFGSPCAGSIRHDRSGASNVHKSSAARRKVARHSRQINRCVRCDNGNGRLGEASNCR